jgi:Fe2+ or Zn2+ uptake regulation protein
MLGPFHTPARRAVIQAILDHPATAPAGVSSLDNHRLAARLQRAGHAVTADQVYAWLREWARLGYLTLLETGRQTVSVWDVQTAALRRLL